MDMKMTMYCCSKNSDCTNIIIEICILLLPWFFLGYTFTFWDATTKKLEIEGWMWIMKPHTCCDVLKNTLLPCPPFLPYTPSLTLYSSCSQCILCCVEAYVSSTVGSHEETTMPCIPTVGSCVAAVDYFIMLGHRICREGLDLGVHGLEWWRTNN